MYRSRSIADWLAIAWMAAVVGAFAIVFFPPAAEHALNGVGARGVVHSIHAVQSWVRSYYQPGR